MVAKCFKRVLPFLFITGAIQTNAQINPRAYYQIGWQFDFPINSGFTDKMNDLGVYLVSVQT